MKIFAPLYHKTEELTKHAHAPAYLYGLTFAESSFFPVPTDIMLAPMCATQPERAWRFAIFVTAASVLGGLFGYLIGYFAFEWLRPLLGEVWMARYQLAHAEFERWGGWAVFVAAFSPIPYKVFTIAAGALGQNLFEFTVASLAGRAARFFIVAALSKYFGPPMLPFIRRHVERLGWAVVAIVGIGIAYYLFVRGGAG